MSPAFHCRGGGPWSPHTNISWVSLMDAASLWEPITVQVINAKGLTGVLMGVLRGQQGPMASEPWLHYITITEMPCPGRGLFSLICLFSFWQFFSLIEHNILRCTKEVILAMSLRFASRNCCFELVFHLLPWRRAGWLLQVTLPCLQLISICHIFKLTSEIGDELSEILGFLSFSSLSCLTLFLSSSPGRL